MGTQSLPIPNVIPNDWKRLDTTIRKIKLHLGSASSPTFTGLTLSGLTASRLIASDANKSLVSSDLVNWVTGTANQITVTDDSDGTITLSLPDPLAIPGKLTAGSQASPTDVTNTRQYGFELHYSGNNYDVTGLRSRAQLVTTDTSASAQGAVLQAANNDGINAGVLNGALIEAIGKSTTTAATISTMRGALVGTEWNAFDTVTNLKTLHVRGHSLNAVGAGSFGTGYGIYIENEVVGGNGQAYDAGIYFKGTNLSGGNKAFTYGIDFSGGTYSSEEIKLANASVIGSDKVTLAPITDSTTFFQINDKDGNVIVNCDTVNNRWGIGTAIPAVKLHVEGTVNIATFGNSSDGILLGQGSGFGKIVGISSDVGGLNDLDIRATSATQLYLKTDGNIGFHETAPETLTEWTGTAPYLTLHNSTHEDTDGGGESRLIFKREDGAGTETAAGQIEISHDGVVANDQLGKMILSVNTGAALAAVVEIDSSGNTKIGDAGTTNYTRFAIDGSLTFVGTAGLAYGEISVKDNAVATTLNSGVEVQLTVFDTNGPSNNTAPDQVNNEITITTAGHYLVTISIHVNNNATQTHIVDVSLNKNNGSRVELTNVHGHRTLTGGSGDVGSMSLSGIVDLAVDDELQLWATTDVAADRSVTFEDITLSIIQIGGT